MDRAVTIVLIGILSLILIHDLQPLVVDAGWIDSGNTAESEHHSSDHSADCDDSCPCINHVLEKSLHFAQFAIANDFPSDFILDTFPTVSENPFIESIDHPPEA